jgi:hypothetical protein
MEAALNQDELQQELHSEEEACSGILPQEFAIEQEQGPFLDAQEDCLAMLDEAAQEATPSEPNLTQDLRLDDTTSSPPITTDGMRALFLSPEAGAPRDTSRNFEESTPGSLRPPTQLTQDRADQGFQPRPHEGQTDPSQPRPDYRPAYKNAGLSSWPPFSDFEPTRPSTRYGQQDRHEPDPDIAGPLIPPHIPHEMRNYPNPIETEPISSQELNGRALRPTQAGHSTQDSGRNQLLDATSQLAPKKNTLLSTTLVAMLLTLSPALKVCIQEPIKYARYQYTACAPL